MKRLPLLFGLLALLAAVWGWFQWRNHTTQVWLESASREQLQTHLQSHAEDPRALLRFGVLLRDSGEREEARKQLRRAVERDAGNEQAWVEYSRALDNPQEALSFLETFLKDHPDSATVQAEFVQRVLQTGDLARALTLAEKTTKNAPESPEAWRSLGEVQYAVRRLPDAEKSLRKALELRDESATRLTLARVLTPLQRYAEVIALCAPLTAANPVLPVSPSQRVRALTYEGGAKLYTPLTPEETTALQTQLRQALENSVQLPAEEQFLPPYFLGESLTQENKAKEAIPHLENSIALNPLFPGSRYTLSRAYRLAGAPQKAQTTSQRHALLSRLLEESSGLSGRLERNPEDGEAQRRMEAVQRELQAFYTK